METPEEIALHNCASEPIHIPGRIQSFGGLIGFDRKTNELQYKSENFDELLAQDKPLKLGDSVEVSLDNSELFHAIRGALGLPTISVQRERLGTFCFNSLRFDAALHISNETVVLELEPLAGPEERTANSVYRVRSMLSSLDFGGTEDSLLESAVNALRNLTGFDRIMGYRFLPNGDGEVSAEARSPMVDAYLGLRYPASDIPPQVREIALRMPFRMIADTTDPHVNIHSTSDEPVDLTLSHLRGVSPIHLKYLDNMGVRATMNVSIIVRGELWGLFAFHHYRSKVLTPEHRSICELFGHLFSLQLQQQLESDLLSRRYRAQSTRSAISRLRSRPLADVFKRLAAEIGETVDADGVALVQETSIQTNGDVPSNRFIRELTSLAKGDLYSVDSILSLDSIGGFELNKTAGALVLAIGGDSKTFVAFFRNEIIENVDWGGSPEKEIAFGPNGPRLNPRSSFSKYSEQVTGKCEPWSRGDLSAASELRSVILDLLFQSISATKEAWEKQSRYQDLLVAELNHRVKNILGLVRTISRQTKESSSSLEAYTESFEKRISALSTAHDLVGGSGMQFARLRELFTIEVEPYVQSERNISITGDPIGLRTDVAPIMSLVIHELVTNSAKYGALSISKASLTISWESDSSGVAIHWIESGVDGIEQPTRRGFGFALIERAIPYECGGEAKVVFGDDGVSVRLWLPADAITKLEEISTDRLSDSKTVTGDSPNVIASEQFVLVVEDNLILAMEYEGMLRDLGYGNIVSAPNEWSARAEIEAYEFSFALLDINLAGNTSFALAELLQEKGVPLAFASGYHSDFEPPSTLTNVPRINKPIERADLEKFICELRED